MAGDDDDEYTKLVRRMNPPRVVIDNDSCDNATVIRVDRVKKHGILLEAVQVLVDLDLLLTKAYISSDGNWFMDVFNVTDQDGRKLVDREIMDCIQRCLESEDGHLVRPPAGGAAASEESMTSIELTGTDRPGLLSEVCAVLVSLSCNIVKGEVWTHGGRAAAVLQITDEATGLAIRDPGRLSKVRELLCNVMHGDGGGGCCSGIAENDHTAVGAAHAERRLHKLMLDDGDDGDGEEDKSDKAKVVVMDCAERRYTVVILRCKDRPKLLFDTLCALADLQYVVFHGTFDAAGGSSNNEAYQEYYIRHVDGHPARSDAERLRLIRCLEAAVERRAFDVRNNLADHIYLLAVFSACKVTSTVAIAGAGAGGDDGGQGGAPVGDHARVPGEQPVDHPGSDLDQERRGRRHLLRVRRLRQPRRRRGHGGVAARAARARRAEGEARGGGRERGGVHHWQPAQGLLQAHQVLLLTSLLKTPTFQELHTAQNNDFFRVRE